MILEILHICLIEDSPLTKYDIGKPYIKDPRAMLEVMEEKTNLPNCPYCSI